MTQVSAVATVLMWVNHRQPDPKKVADENRLIWRELHLPAVSG
jgi:hypothetical protein